MCWSMMWYSHAKMHADDTERSLWACHEKPQPLNVFTFGSSVSNAPVMLNAVHQLQPVYLLACLQVSLFEGTCYVTPLLGAYLADARWGRYTTILVFSCVYLLVGCPASMDQALILTSSVLHRFHLPQSSTYCQRRKRLMYTTCLAYAVI